MPAPESAFFARYGGVHAAAGSTVAAVLLAVLCGLAVRVGTGFHPYSGEAQPPRHGDYEAQRHWMELTLHVPLEAWYSFDVAYWGLDYPPLTAYHAWLVGKASQLIEPESVALNTSRGYETLSHRAFMRNSALLSDMLIFFPALLLYFLAPPPALREAFASYSSFDLVLTALTVPGFIIIDHGHFQYNAVALGLLLAGLYFLLFDDLPRHLMAAFCFVLSLNFKQLGLYFAPRTFSDWSIFSYTAVFFVVLLSKSVYSTSEGFALRLLRLLMVAVVTLGTFAIVWAPFLRAGEPVVRQVLHRLFPVARGLYEDKVANVWCSLAPLLKMNVIFSPSQTLLLCACCTLVTILPALVAVFLRPTPHRVLWASFACSMAFFLFSYHVHEKTVLYPLVPATLLFPLAPTFSSAFALISAFRALSMYPLIALDKLSLAYATLLGLYALAVRYVVPVAVLPVLYLILCAMSGVHVLSAFGPLPPAHLPHIYNIVFTTLSCGFFVICYAYAIIQSYRGEKRKKKKKH